MGAAANFPGANRQRILHFLRAAFRRLIARTIASERTID
jgi:RNA-splicing ligase RtcB